MSERELHAIERALRRGAPTSGEDADALAGELALRADDAGLVDVAYATLDTPLGEMLVATTRTGLVRVGLPRESFDRDLELLAARVSPRVLELPSRTDDPRRELEEYFAGRRQEFDLRLDWRLVHGEFARKLLRGLPRVPYGETISYAEAARRGGSPRAHRAAGNVLGGNPIPVVVPCHRVIRSGGDLGGYGGGPDMKRFLLEHEGRTSDA
jgi:methylated-DNA-[protein]-cysteine S-methyltransferase